MREKVDGFLVGAGATPPDGVPQEALDQALAGGSVSTEGDRSDGPVLVEARPLRVGGAVVLVQPYTVVGVEAGDGVRRIVIALLLGLLIAVPVAAVVKLLILRGLERYEESDFFRGGQTTPSE